MATLNSSLSVLATLNSSLSVLPTQVQNRAIGLLDFHKLSRVTRVGENSLKGLVADGDDALVTQVCALASKQVCSVDHHSDIITDASQFNLE